MQPSDLVDTPMVEKGKLNKDLQSKSVDPTHYCGMIGCIMFLTSSRPDLVFAMCMCARYQAKPTEKHLHYMQMQTTSGVKILDEAHLEVHNSWRINFKIPLYCDNKSEITLCCNNAQHLRSKHIDVRYHFIKEQVENKMVELYFVRTKYQLAYIFTKSLPRERFNFLIESLGMKSMSLETLKSLAEKDEE
uniref:Retrotransposon protein, putative, unclassified n=1 Tax=Tanacetum cinerariifolium TaxID=118510 RepID=A0A6L2K0D3_TANCI|nr:retrotransposon protein, putative, unclassified [Tanacetum cinerariifolium]